MLVDAGDMDANPRVLLGRPAADLVGRALTDLIEPCGTEDGAIVDCPAPVCYSLAGAGGESTFYGVSSASFTHEGRSLVLYLLHDVTF